jgi:hypothetical protein
MRARGMREPVISVAVSDAARLVGGVPWPAWDPPDGPTAPLSLFLGWEVVARAGAPQVAAWRAQLAALARCGWRIREQPDGRRWGLVVTLTPPGVPPPHVPQAAPAARPRVSRGATPGARPRRTR